MMKTIKLDVDLGGSRTYSDGIPMKDPSGPSKEENYPEFSFVEDSPCQLPEHGELTIEYRLTRHATDTRDESNPKYSYTICVKKLISAEGESDKSPTRKYSEGGEALDALVAEKESASELEEY